MNPDPPRRIEVEWRGPSGPLAQADANGEVIDLQREISLARRDRGRCAGGRGLHHAERQHALAALSVESFLAEFVTVYLAGQPVVR